MTRTVRDARGVSWELRDLGPNGDANVPAAARSSIVRGATTLCTIAAQSSRGVRVEFSLPLGQLDRLPERELLRCIARELRRKSRSIPLEES